MKRQTARLSFANIKEAVPLDLALFSYGIILKASGKSLIGCCPIHLGTNKRAFVVSADRRAWHCFGDCARGGTVIDLIMELEDCSLSEATEIIVKRYGIRSSP